MTPTPCTCGKPGTFAVATFIEQTTASAPDTTYWRDRTNRKKSVQYVCRDCLAAVFTIR